ncbi:MAG TPA: Uma2 family endonuclease [Bryobacteraceae bacterium]|nr:Uma2 family endonuclease [Bryobacteraceae bacterium]
MATRTIMSLAEFLKLPGYELDGTHYELDEGHLIALSPNARLHGVLMARIAAYLDRVVDPKRFTVVCGDVGYILDKREDRPTVRGADVSVEATPADNWNRAQRAPNALCAPNNPNVPEGFQDNAPFVAIEIISESNTKRDIQRKTAQYLGAGGQEVWLVYPDTEETHVFRAGQQLPEVYGRAKSFLSCLGMRIDTDKLFSR